MRKLSTWFLSLMLVAALVFGAIAVMAADAPALPTSNVSEIENEELTFALNFKAAQANAEQLAYYGDWYADFELTVNKDITLYTEEGADGYLSGQYDAWSENWVNVPFNKAVSLKAGETVKVMAFAAELMGKPGLKYTYKEVYESVKDFDCGMFLTEEYMQANPDLEVTLGLYAYNNENEAERYLIGRSYTFCLGYVAQNVQTGVMYDDVSDAMQAAADGQTVRLLKNADELVLTVKENTTLDLNGHELAVTYASVFGFMEDNSANNTGVLKVADTKLLINSENTQLPVKTEEGYRFVEVIGFNTAWMNENTFVFQPLFEKAANELLKNGVANTGVSIQVEVTWKPAAGSEDLDSRTFKYGDTLVNDFIGSYDASTGKYGRMFTLALVNPDNYVDLSCHSKVVSTTRVEFAPQQGNAYVTEEVQLTNEQASAVVPVGTKLKDANAALTLNTTEMDKTTTDVVLTDGETMLSMDVHVDGVAADNTVPVIVTLNEITMNGLNEGNIALYHVENGETVKMTRVYTIEEVDEHNEYYYDIATGTITMALKSFSEVAVVAETAKAWEGNFDYSWYTNAVAPVDGEAVTEYVIANADQLAAFGAIVGGMNGKTADSFSGKTVKLISDINLGDKEPENNPNIIFYPIGYYNSEGTYERSNTGITSGLRNFEGTFDGNGHTVSNFYQNTWEMKGDHDWYSPEEQYYRDGMGLFGRVYKATIKNLTVKNFSSDGEIATTGCIAAYADGATFENIAIFDCNPRVYNIGNGGIVGCVGWYAKEANLKTTFENITVDNSNKISALWGSYDVACGGLVGQYYPTSGQSGANYPVNAGIHMENCHVSAQMDVYNDVCANYQYYAYRYTGMLIGSVRENVNGDGSTLYPETGRVYPKMDGITAKGCTVHFGTWNDYYYCEIIDNTTASYTHDYQMSRLTEIKAIDGTTVTYLDGTTGTVPASGRANYVIVDYTKGHGTENATCYHFKNGEVWNHTDAGTEKVNGEEVLVEDKQHIYLEFNNLVTGYGWGVTTKGVDDLDGVDILDRKEGNSVEKFAKSDTAKDSYTTGATVTIGELFVATEAGLAEKTKIVSGSVMVAVSPNGESSTAGGTYTADTEDWTKGTLTFTGTGAATITITDYYFCTPTTITVTVNDRQPAEKFETKFTGDFLYRVGNQNAVKLDNLFKAKDGVKIGNVTVTIESVTGTAGSGTYTPDATLTNETIQFTGTGVVKVTIKDDDTYCLPTVLYLEVVEAWNTLEATDVPYTHEGKDYNVVLLQSATASSLTIKDGYSFYGNDFTLTFNGDGSYRSASLAYGFVTVQNGGVLDNTRVVCKVFPKSYMYTSQMEAGTDGRYPYGYSAVIVSGNSTISNCYIYGARNNILVSSGNVTISNTVTESGSLANIHIKGSSADTVILDNVTTIQKLIKSDASFDTVNNIIGFGVAVGDNDSSSNANIKLTGNFVQHNWITSADADAMRNINGGYAQSAMSGALKVTKYQHTNKNGDTTVNMGIAALNTLGFSVEDKRSDTSVTYEMNNVSMNGYTGSVYSIINNSGSPDAGAGEYESKTNANIMPNVVYADDTQGLSVSTAFDPDNAWVSTLALELDVIAGGSYAFSFEKLKIQKYGHDLVYEVKDAAGNVIDKSDSVTFSGMENREYTLVVTDDRIYDKSGKDTDEVDTYELSFLIHATKASIDPPKFTGIGAGVEGSIRLVSSKGGNWRPAYPALQGVSVDYWSASEGKVKTVDLSTLTNKGTIKDKVWTYTCDDYTLTITGGPVHSDNSPKIYPMLATRDGEKILYFAGKDKDNSTGTTARKICLEYTFTDKNASTTVGQATDYKGTGIATVNYADLPEFSWSSFQKGTVEEVSSGSSTCLAEGAMITLADGTKRAVEDVRKGDLVLAVDHNTGDVVVSDVIIVVKNPGSFYRNVFIFDDGTELPTINEHGIFDLDLNKYVNIDHLNYRDYVGHCFVAIDTAGNIGEKKLVAVTSEWTSGYKYDIVTNGTLNYVAEDTLSVTHGLVAGSNTFDFGSNLMIDHEKMQSDIEKYGLYTYEDWADVCDYSVFKQYNIAVFKVGVEKGLYSVDIIFEYLNDYVYNDNAQIND